MTDASRTRDEYKDWLAEAGRWTTKNTGVEYAAWITLGRLLDKGDRPATRHYTHLICGLINTKDAGEFFDAFAGLALDVTCVGFSSDAAIPADELAACARAHGLNAKTADSVLSAVQSLPDTPSRVVICGSLYLAGDVLAMSPDTFPT